MIYLILCSCRIFRGVRHTRYVSRANLSKHELCNILLNFHDYCTILLCLHENGNTDYYKTTLSNEFCRRSMCALSFSKNFSVYRTRSQCDSVQDLLSVYDGRTTAFPELARICGGDYLPDIISSGPDMLIEFQTSPYDSLYHPTPISFLLGFEIQIQVNIICSMQCKLFNNFHLNSWFCIRK